MPEPRGALFALLARPRRVLLLCLALALLALWPASQLAFDADLLSLLPQGSPAAEGYRAFEEHFGGAEKVFVLLRLAKTEESPVEADVRHPEEAVATLLAAAEELRKRLAQSPEVASARAGLESEEETLYLEHLVPRAPLWIESDDWRQQIQARLEPEAVRRRVASLRAEITTPGAGTPVAILTRDPLGFLDALPELGAGASSLPIDPLSLTFLSSAEDASLVILTPARSELDPEAGRALEAELERAFAELRAEMGADLRFHAVGGPLYAAQDERLLRVDLQRTITGSAIGCTMLLLLAFEGLLLPLAALAALALGLLWTAAWMGAALSPLTAVGVGFAAVLVGLGVDYAIHGAARYRQELLGGQGQAQALVATFRHAGPALLTSALTTAAAFSILGFAHFRPLRELGLVVAGGIVAILLATATFGAALLGSIGQRPRPSGPAWRLLGRLSQSLVHFGEHNRKPVLGLALILSAAGAWGLGGLRLDTDPSAFRPHDHPAREAEQRLVDSFDLGLDTTTVVLSAPSLEETLERASAAEALLQQHLGQGLDLSSPTRWLRPQARQRERLKALEELPFAEAAEILEKELARKGLAPTAFAPGLAALRAFARGEDPAPLAPEAWPDGLKELIRHTPEDGTSKGTSHAALRLRLPDGSWPEGPPAALLSALDDVAPGVQVASVPAIGAELGDLARGDLRRLSLLAFLIVGLVVLISFRGSLVESVLALLPVILGSLWTLGLWGLLGRPIDLLSLAVVPIMLGIGIDDGLHALHGARRAGLTASIRAASRAMTLTTLTTCVGFGSLTLSRVPGLANGGLLVAIGVAACWLATLLVLPALGRQRPRH